MHFTKFRLLLNPFTNTYLPRSSAKTYYIFPKDQFIIWSLHKHTVHEVCLICTCIHSQNEFVFSLQIHAFPKASVHSLDQLGGQERNNTILNKGSNRHNCSTVVGEVIEITVADQQQRQNLEGLRHNLSRFWRCCRDVKVQELRNSFCLRKCIYTDSWYTHERLHTHFMILYFMHCSNLSPENIYQL